MSITNKGPIYSLPFVITAAAGPHLTINHSGGFNFAITLDDGTYFLDDSGTAADLLAHANTKIEAALVAGNRSGTLTLAAPSGGLSHRIEATFVNTPIRAVGMTSLDSFVFNTSELTIDDFGWGLPGGSNSIAFSPTTLPDAAITGTYQRGGVWLPRTGLTVNEPIAERWIERAKSRSQALGVTEDVYAKLRIRLTQHLYVEPALIWTGYTGRTGTAARVSGLDTADPNVSFEAWYDRYLGLISDSVPPTCRMAPLNTAAGTDIASFILDEDPEIVEGNSAPKLYHHRLRLREV